jgi:hypothetical protein
MFLIHHYPDDKVVALAVLLIGGPTGRQVQFNDYNYIECNGVRFGLYREPQSSSRFYGAEVVPDGRGVYEFKLVRNDSSISTFVTAPAFPAITATNPDNTIHAGTVLEVDWDASEPGQYIEFNLFGNCIRNTFELDVEDDGNHTLQCIITDADPNNPQQGTVDLQIHRALEGQVAEGFLDGYTVAERIDIKTFNYD